MPSGTAFSLTLLGTGTSFGVPVIGCTCATCTSSDSRDRRLRVSLWVQWDGTSVLIDTSPDLRAQALTHGIHRLDAILLTHAHADHLHGLDDVRVYCGRQRSVLPCFATRQTLASAARGFGYAFARNHAIPLGGIPQLAPMPIAGAFALAGTTVTPINLPHGKGTSTAFRFADAFAYVTDVHDIPASKLALFEGLDVLILDCLRERPHPTHLHLARSLELAAQLGARRTIFTHIAHDLRHALVAQTLPPGVELGFDGLEIEARASATR